MKRILPILGFIAATTCVAALAFAEPVESLAKRLAELRAEVDALSSRVAETKEGQRAEQRSLAAQRADLEFQLQREQSRIARLRAQAEERKQTVASASTDTAEFMPAITDAIELLRGRVRGGLPFKTVERLGAIDELDQRVKAGLVSPQKAGVQLWALVEDELRLGRENGLYRQVIELGGEEVLVDVARLGMVAIYFRTADGRVGWVVRNPGGWQWVVERDEHGKRQIDALFEALRKQIRTGWFELPALPRGEQ